MYEKKSERLLPLHLFVGRMVRTALLAVGIVTIALAIGIAGYHEFAGLSLVDSILNASMILTGMGPVNAMSSTAAKLFASVYAIFSGVVFLSAVALILSPVFHRILHKFHLDEED